MYCKHYKVNGFGAKCGARPLSDNGGYCKRHRKNDVDQIIDDMLSTSPPLSRSPFTLNDICCCSSFGNSTSKTTHLDIVLETIVPLNDLAKLWSKTTTGLNTNKKAMSKRVAAAATARLIEGMWQIRQRPELEAAVQVIQRSWRHRRDEKAKIEKAKAKAKRENECDPFTLESVDEIEERRLFKYRDGGGRWWGFSAPHMLHWTNSEKINPFTRETIAESDLERLAGLVAKLADDRDDTNNTNNTDNPFNIEIAIATPHDAFMSALYEIDRIGFYTKIEWFLDLSVENIIDIVFRFNNQNRIATKALTTTCLYEAISCETNLHMHLASELKSMIQASSDKKFALICNFLVALGHVNHRARRELPSWIWNH